MISSVQTNQQKTTAMTIKVVRSTYRGAGVLGDYLWMIDQPEFARALFIFNDNEEQFDAYVAGEANGFTAGGGNAAIRPLRKHLPGQDVHRLSSSQKIGCPDKKSSDSAA